MSVDPYDFFEEIARDEFIERTLRDISEDGVRSYLGTYGDAVDARVSSALTQAHQLKDAGWCDPSVVMAVTAMELTVRFLLVRPLIQAAFSSEDWAEFLTRRIVASRTSDDRKLLPEILKFHDLDIAKVLLTDGRELWPTILEIYKVRNRVVHAATPATFENSQDAISCAEALRDHVVAPLAKKYGFTLDATNEWCNIQKDEVHARYNARSPFR